jgi:hypothetical protein
VWDIGHPIFEAPTKEMSVVVADRYERRVARQVSLGHIDRAGPDMIYGSVRREEF